MPTVSLRSPRLRGVLLRVAPPTSSNARFGGKSLVILLCCHVFDCTVVPVLLLKAAFWLVVRAAVTAPSPKKPQARFFVFCVLEREFTLKARANVLSQGRKKNVLRYCGRATRHTAVTTVHATIEPLRSRCRRCYKVGATVHREYAKGVAAETRHVNYDTNVE